MARPKTVYRGRTRFGRLVTVLAFVVIFAVIIFVALFYYLQQYIVYDKDTLRLDVPFLRVEGEGDVSLSNDMPVLTTLSPDEVEIVIATPDLSELETGAGEDLEILRAKYVYAENVSGTALTLLAADMPTATVSAIVIELKTPDGNLAYASSVPLASSYGVNGTEDISGAVAALGDKGIYLVAELSCLVDDAMATRNAPLALKSAASGSAVTDARGSWLDPYNRDARGYITDLIAELAEMGFDEVLLTNVAQPDRDDVKYSQSMTQELSRVSSVSVYAKHVSDAARASGIKVSVVCYGDLFRQGTSEAAGQDIEFFFSVFDRVCIRTDSSYYASDMAMLASALGEESGTRIVPVISGFVPDEGSYIGG